MTTSAAVAHGYTMHELDRIARIAVSNPFTGIGRSNADADELYEAAWGAAAELLCSAAEPPLLQDLMAVARRAVDTTRRVINRHRGLDEARPWAGLYAAERYVRFWLNPSPGDPVADRVVDSLAVQQVVDQLTPGRRRALVVLAVHNGDIAAAAETYGRSRQAYGTQVWSARRSALTLWHDGETPRHPTQVLSTAGRATDFPCGTNQAYRRHARRREQPCEDCREAHRKHMADYHQKRKARVTGEAA